MNIVIGAIVGSDIYIVPGITAGLIGPFAIVVWIVAGAVSMVLVMVFAYCSYYVPNVGGSYAYASTAFSKFYGFLAGWSMCVAEIVALPVFAIVFTNYLEYFLFLSSTEEFAIRVLFVFAMVWVNIRGVKAAGRLNDVLTIVKLAPLVIIIVLGLGSLIVHPNLLGNYTPFAPFGLGNFGAAFVLIFWAYAGFELGSLPASEVVEPKKTIPKALISGMAIVILFYVLTGVSVFGVVGVARLASSPIPLVLVSSVLLGSVGAGITGIGALASVSGTDETEVLGTARLMYAMSADGLFPRAFSKVHLKYKTPYVGVAVEGCIAICLSLFSGITQLISFAVFNLAVCYLLVCLSLVVLAQKGGEGLRGQRVLPWLGVAISLYLMIATSLVDVVIGVAFVLIGIPVYIFYSRTHLGELREMFLTQEEILVNNLEKGNRVLPRVVRLVRRLFKRAPTSKLTNEKA
jgi:amino acid transporter